jgi:hypothetical protein
MKKVLIALAIVIYAASSSFAGISFLTGTAVGEGKLALVGIYATNHNGDNGGAANAMSDPQAFDTNNIGVRGEYGITKDLDVLFAYTMDTYVNARANEFKAVNGTTTGLGLKYAVAKAGDSFPVNASVAFGIETSTVTVKPDAGGSTAMGDQVMSLAGIFSKQIGICMPYGAIAYRMHSQNNGNMGYGATDLVSGTGLGFNIGCAIGVAENQAVMVEYNTENIAWKDIKTKSGIKMSDETATSVSGISLGYVYMF